VTEMATIGAAPVFDFSAARRDEIREALRRALAAAPEVAFAFVHGSFVTAGPFHDIDVAVYLTDLSPSEISRWIWELAPNLEAAVFGDMERPYPPIDLRALNAAPLGFCYQVLRTGALLVNRDDALRTEWTATTVSRYLDLQPLVETALKEAMMSWH
jgi:uncharacterized protein